MLPKTIEIAGQRMTVRDAVADDIALIFPTWMESARDLRQTRLTIFNRFYEHVVRGLLETESAVVLTREGKNTIHAWACGRAPNLLHFAYVPVHLRGNGFGRAVISAVLEGYPETVFVTSSPLAQPHHKRFQFNPFVMRAA